MRLTPLELSTLIALARLGPDTYAVPIREDIRASTGRTASIATVYAALDRLNRLGLARMEMSEPRPERGGRARRQYTLTAGGRTRVRQEREHTERLWRGVAANAGGDR
jgi:DNA-binding PadR family transcriptional regulator